MNVQLSSPCPMSWDKMPGGSRVRYCSGCRLNVYNLAEMSSQEVAALFRKGRVCGRLFLREDRTATLRDCSQGSARRKLRRALTLVGVLILGTLGWLLRLSGDRDRTVHPQWVRDVVEWVDPQPQPQPRGVLTLGEICPTPPTNSPSVTPQ
jgi:hypothetical protein